jgi:hypothetical protein
MAYLIIAFVVIMAISPIFWMRPSPRQKQLERLRDYAVKQGLDVSIAKLPEKLRYRHDFDMMTCYSKYHPRGAKQQNVLRKKWFISMEKGFDWVSRPDLEYQQQLQEITADLPESCSYVEAEQLFVAVYWREKGDSSTVDQVTEVIEKIMLIQSQNNREQ